MTDLIDRLRRFADDEQYPTFDSVGRVLHEAADALEAKNAVIERLQRLLDMYKHPESQERATLALNVIDAARQYHLVTKEWIHYADFRAASDFCLILGEAFDNYDKEQNDD